MGTRKKERLFTALFQDHPHAYGDKRTAGKTTDFAKGSSPRVWGQAKSDIIKKSALGIIPTRMGTRIAGMPKKTVKEDHPHAYGDKINR